MRMTTISTIEDLEAIYGTPAEAALVKVAHRITPEYRQLIEASSLLALATVEPEGLDCSPRGDRRQVVFIHDDTTLLIPDRRGNNRIDSLRNIVRDPRVALMFLIPGSNTTLRFNGSAVISVEPAPGSTAGTSRTKRSAIPAGPSPIISMPRASPARPAEAGGRAPTTATGGAAAAS
jgi:PPOX class probable FMN-dependent enzyme